MRWRWPEGFGGPMFGFGWAVAVAVVGVVVAEAGPGMDEARMLAEGGAT